MRGSETDGADVGQRPPSNAPDPANGKAGTFVDDGRRGRRCRQRREQRCYLNAHPLALCPGRRRERHVERRRVRARVPTPQPGDPDRSTAVDNRVRVDDHACCPFKKVHHPRLADPANLRQHLHGVEPQLPARRVVRRHRHRAHGLHIVGADHVGRHERRHDGVRAQRSAAGPGPVGRVPAALGRLGVGGVGRGGSRFQRVWQGLLLVLVQHRQPVLARLCGHRVRNHQHRHHDSHHLRCSRVPPALADLGARKQPHDRVERRDPHPLAAIHPHSDRPKNPP
ncbi:hypothetical protein DFJ73DRAFT_832376 [Zopfochytrium polystomum]|nr:hypothetical protein DFJ73DRAFT_832376 [Zopfochytrium polystomum]